jgi:hypothetical protein
MVVMARRSSGERVAFEADVTKQATLATMVEAAQRRWGRIDILHYNVGISRRRGLVRKTAAKPLALDSAPATAPAMKYRAGPCVGQLNTLKEIYESSCTWLRQAQARYVATPPTSTEARGNFAALAPRCQRAVCLVPVPYVPAPPRLFCKPHAARRAAGWLVRTNRQAFSLRLFSITR